MKNKRSITVVIIFVALFLIGTGVYVVANQNHFDTLDSIAAEYGHVYTVISGNGEIAAENKVSTYVEIPQTITVVHVKTGDVVNAGDVLITYDIESDKKDIIRQINEAQLNLENAKLNLSVISSSVSRNELIQHENDVLSAKKNIEDVKSEIAIMDITIEQQEIKMKDAQALMQKNSILLADGAIPQVVYDGNIIDYELCKKTLNALIAEKEQNENTLATFDSQLDYANQMLENAKTPLLDETTAIKYEIQKNTIALYNLSIEKLNGELNKLVPLSYATIDGSVSNVSVTNGGTASKNIELVTVSDTSKVIALLDISEYDTPKVEVGSRVEITTSALPDTIYDGIVTKIANEAFKIEDYTDDEAVVPIEIEITNVDDKLKIGYSVDIDIYIKEKKNVLCLPVESIVEKDGQKYCYLQTSGEHILTPLETGLYGDKYVEILLGLEGGEEVVLTPWKVPDV